MVSKGTLSKHNEIVFQDLSHLDEEGFALKLSKQEITVDKLEWLGFDIHLTSYFPKFSKTDSVKNLAAPRAL